MEEPTVTQAILELAPNAEFSYDTDGDGNWTITNWYSDDIDQPSNLIQKLIYRATNRLQ